MWAREFRAQAGWSGTASLAAKRKYLAERSKSEGRGPATKRHDNDLAQIPFRGPMHPAGRMIEDTAHGYYHRPHVGGELTFADKESPAIHLTPCPACPDGPPANNAAAPSGRTHEH